MSEGRPPFQWVTLASLLREPIRNGYSPNCPSFPTGVWTLSLGALGESGFVPTARKPAPTDDPKVEAARLDPGDILVSRSNTRERVGFAGMYLGAPNPCSYPDLMMRVRTDASRVDPNYLLAALTCPLVRGPLQQAARGTSGSMVKINAKILGEAAIPLPPYPEQKKIAAVLSSVDKVIEATQAVIEQTRRMKQGLMEELLTRGIGHTEFQETRFGLAPRAWQEVSLDELARRASGHTPNKKQPHYWNGGVGWVSLKDSFRLDKREILETTDETSEEGLANSSAVLLPKDTVVVLRDASVGRVGILGRPLATSQHFINYVCSPRLNHLYLYSWFQRIRPFLEREATGNTVKTIGVGFFKSLKIPLPPRSEQDQIAKAILGIELRGEAEETSQRAWQQVKRGLMQDLLSGRRRVQLSPEDIAAAEAEAAQAARETAQQPVAPTLKKRGRKERARA